jgi:hypothetical protein
MQKPERTQGPTGRTDTAKRIKKNEKEKERKEVRQLIITLLRTWIPQKEKKTKK